MMGIRFFEPNKTMLQWLRDYVGDRLIIDVGCGEGDVLIELQSRTVGKTPLKCIGIEPMLDMETRISLTLDKNLQIVPLPIQSCKAIVQGLKGKAIMMFARPCHSTFVEEGINIAPSGMEILYITKPENVADYQDLGRFDDQKVLLKHKGKGKENEVVYSIIKK